MHASAASHHTAARLLGGIVPDTDEVHLATVLDKRSRTHGIRTHRYPAAPIVTTCRGVPTTTAEQTFVDLAGCLDLVDLVVLGDSLIRHGRTTPEQLISMTDSSSVRGAVRARKAARLVRVEVDSAYETRLRLLIMFAGLPEPVINYCILDGQGRTARRFDLSYPHLMLAIEYDGRDHIDRESQWRNDITRREELESAGWRFMVITGADLLQHPEHVLRRITGAVQAAGASHLA
ncbi:DUF559 domain-containing protein [Dermatophilaceae bacterium Sec6.4]